MAPGLLGTIRPTKSSWFRKEELLESHDIKAISPLLTVPALFVLTDLKVPSITIFYYISGRTTELIDRQVTLTSRVVASEPMPACVVKGSIKGFSIASGAGNIKNSCAACSGSEPFEPKIFTAPAIVVRKRRRRGWIAMLNKAGVGALPVLVCLYYAQSACPHLRRASSHLVDFRRP